MQSRLPGRLHLNYMHSMKVKEADILIVPGFTNAGPAHWLTRWEEKLSSARRVEGLDWHKPEREEWTKRIAGTVADAKRPVVLVAHSLGAAACVLAAPLYPGNVAGAFLVAVPDVSNSAIRPKHLGTFGPYSRDPLPFPSVTIASRNDPFCAIETAEDLAAAWGSLFIDAGEAGHLNEEAGFGPWPEGSMVFAQFLSRL